MKIKTQKTIKQAAGSYLRAAVSAVIAYYLATGDMDLRALGSAALAAIIGPAARWANPKDTLGR
jgi:hypothetical protein